jgi:hypothetical protein
VLFDRICREHGIRHLLTAPRSPTTGKVERWHKTLRAEFLDGKVFADLGDAQAQLDAWVEYYNHDRPHQGIGMVAPWERFRLADFTPAADEQDETVADEALQVGSQVSATTRKVTATGMICFASTRYPVGRWLAGQTVEVVCDRGLVHICHHGVLVATHARRHRLEDEQKGLRRATKPVVRGRRRRRHR